MLFIQWSLFQAVLIFVAAVVIELVSSLLLMLRLRGIRTVVVQDVVLASCVFFLYYGFLGDFLFLFLLVGDFGDRSGPISRPNSHQPK